MYKIMIVDDERGIRENLPKAIEFEENEFCVCAVAANGVEALEKVASYRPDVVLLDVCMPVLDGLGFLEVLRQGEYKDTRVIMLSGFSDFHYAKKAMRWGVKAYLTKPIDEDEIIELLQEVKEEIQSEQEVRYQEDSAIYLQRLEELYKGGKEERTFWESFVLVHIAALSLPVIEEISVFECLQAQLEQLWPQCRAHLFRSRGSVYTYLVPYQLLKDHNIEVESMAETIVRTNLHIELAVLIDEVIFKEAQHTFREDYSSHLYKMLEEVFYKDKRVVRYEGAYKSRVSEWWLEKENGLEYLKPSLLELNVEEIERRIVELMDEVGKRCVSMEVIQEINYRLYYLIVDTLFDKQAAKLGVTFKPYEWRDAPFFMCFKSWKNMQVEQITEVIMRLREARSMGNVGVGEEVARYIQSNYEKSITLKEVADQFYVNAAYLGRMFHKVMGVSFKQYINTLRIEEAKKLLIRTDRLIYEIAEQVGYTESKYFIAKFIKEVGMSPSEYRKKYEV